jgi:chromosomal replication initiator protein
VSGELFHVLQTPAKRTHSSPPAFEPFLVLPENRLAYTAVVESSNVKSRKALPLVYLYGPSGVGKSHLARHCLRLKLRENPNCRYVLMTAGEFAAQFAESSQAKTLPEFQEARKNIELFVLEDLRELENRPETQRQLLSLYDELAPKQCQFVFTSRKLPGEMESFLPRLVNRLHGGVSALMKLPGAASRESLVSHFAKNRQIALPDEVAKLLAEEFPVSPRELSGLVLQLEAAALRKRSHISLAFARKYLKDEVQAPQLTLGEISKTVARHFQISLAQLRSRTRIQGLVLPRQCAMFLARELTSQRLEQIGKYFSDRDHSTVVHACHRLQELLANQPNLRQHLFQIRQDLGRE